jgi:RNA polymerase sigma-70 factor, ECF subfamily
MVTSSIAHRYLVGALSSKERHVEGRRAERDSARCRGAVALSPATRLGPPRLQAATQDLAARRAMQSMSRGDVEALRPIYDRFANRALAVCLRILRDRAVASDALQETFLEVWRRAREYDPRRGNLECWIATIARSRALDHLRARKTAMRVVSSVEQRSVLSVAPAPPDVLASEGDDRARVAAALRELPAQQQVAIGLAFFEGLSHSEISERTGDPLGTVKTRVRLGMSKLAILLEQR